MPTIAVHPGQFHLDDALSVWMLRCTEEFKGAKVVRTTDEAVLATCEAVVDVGGVYDHTTHHYDHHQRGFFETFCLETKGIKMASAGLIWRHWGKEILRNIITSMSSSSSSSSSSSATITDKQIDMLHKRIYLSFIAAVDAKDNGIQEYPELKGEAPLFVDHTTLAHRIAMLNPRWNEPPQSPAARQAKFEQAVELAGKELSEKVEFMMLSWLPARAIVEDAFEKRSEGGRLVTFPKGVSVPFQDHLRDLEVENGVEGSVWYVRTWDSGREQWSTLAMPKHAGSFETRAPFPVAWAGLRDEELAKVSGCPGAVFTHVNRFVCCNRSDEGMLKMIQLSIKTHQEALVPAPVADVPTSTPPPSL